MEYLVEKESNQKIMLQASSALSINTHFWYVNERYIGKTEKSGKLFFKPVEGKVNIICVNDVGAENKTEITVKYF
jgi:membrane carboxypeptidase/penicillin-binding protein PbpC